MLAIGASLNIGVRVGIQDVANTTSDVDEVRDCTVVHESDSSEQKRMVVHLSDGGC